MSAPYQHLMYPPPPPHPPPSTSPAVMLAPRLYIVLKLGHGTLAPDRIQDLMVLIGGHPYPIPALSTAYLQLLLGTNPLHGAPTPPYGYYSNFEMNLIKCQPTYYAIMIIYVNWEKENKIFYSILFYSILSGE
jgi:hypothetical protein